MLGDPMAPATTMDRLRAALLLLGGAAAGCAEDAARTGLACPAPAFLFGAVYEGAVLVHEFALEVRGEPLSIRAIDSDCGCTLARLERIGAAGAREAVELGAALEPGTRLFLAARYDTRGKRGPTQRSIQVRADPLHGGPAADGAPLVLTLAAVVGPWLVAEPDELGYVRLAEGESGERSFRVRSVAGESFHLSATRRGIPDALGIDLAPEEPDGAGRARAWRVRLAMGSELPRGVHSYPIELVSDVENPDGAPGEDGARARHALAPALGVEVLGPVSLSPPSVVFGVVGADETVARTVRLECHDPGFVLAEPKARVEPLRAEEPFPLGRTASVRTRPVAGQNAWEIEVLLGGLDEAVTGTFLARLVVDTGHPTLGRLEAPISGVRRPGRGGRG